MKIEIKRVSGNKLYINGDIFMKCLNNLIGKIMNTETLCKDYIFYKNSMHCEFFKIEVGKTYECTYYTTLEKVRNYLNNKVNDERFKKYTKADIIMFINRYL